MFDKVTDKVREAPPPSLAPTQVGTDGEKTAAHQKETERRGNVVNESFSIPGVTKAILEHLHIQGAPPERAASTHVGTTEVIAAKMDKVADGRDRGHGDKSSGMGEVSQLSRRPPGGEGTQELPQSARAALDRLITTQKQMESNPGREGSSSGDQLFVAANKKEDHNEHDRNAGGQDVGKASTEQDGHHLAFRGAAETSLVSLKLQQILDKLSNGPIGSTIFTHKDIEACFAVQSLTGHIVTNFQQEFASDRPPEPLGVDKLAITERDGRILLTTPEGTALVNKQGKPVMATELGSYLQKDGTVMVDGQGHLHRPGDTQHARPAQQEQLTAAHKKEAEKVRVRQEMEATLDSVASRDRLAESMRGSRPELMQALIETAESSVRKADEEKVRRVEALYLARRIMDDNEIDEIADSEFEVDAEEAETRPDQSSSDCSVEPPGESEIEEGLDGDSQETDDVADYSQKEILRQGQTAILTQQGNNAAQDDEDKQQPQNEPKQQAQPQANEPQPNQSQTNLPQASEPQPNQSQTNLPQASEPQPNQSQTNLPQANEPQPNQSNRSQPQSKDSPANRKEPTQSQVHLATIERLLTDLSGIVASASVKYDRKVEAPSTQHQSEPAFASHREPQADTVPLPVMAAPQRSARPEPMQAAPYDIHSRADCSQVMYRTNIGEIISVSAAHVVTNMFY